MPVHDLTTTTLVVVRNPFERIVAIYNKRFSDGQPVIPLLNREINSRVIPRASSWELEAMPR